MHGRGISYFTSTDHARATIDHGEETTLSFGGPIELEAERVETLRCTSSGGDDSDGDGVRTLFDSPDITAIKVERFHPSCLNSFVAPPGIC